VTARIIDSPEYPRGGIASAHAPASITGQRV